MRLVKKSRVCLLFISFLFFSAAKANDSQAPAAGEHGSAAGPAADYSGKQTQEWNEVQTKLSALKSKVDAQEALVKSLLVEKPGAGHGAPPAESGGGSGHETSAPAGGHAADGGSEGAMAARIEQLKKEHAKLQTLIADYNKMNLDYETRFPEKGLKESRIYRRLDPQAIQSDEGVSSYEERLQRLQNRILRQYPKTAKRIQAEKKPKKQPVKIKADQSQKEAPKMGDVTEQIILKK